MKSLYSGLLCKYSKCTKNNNYSFNKKNILKILSKEEIDKAYLSISKWENYKATPLLLLDKLSKELNLKNIYYKDESKRFGLKSFKALGGAYAVEEIAKKKKNITVSSATAGNHGRSVAWGAKRMGLKCKIFISEYVTNVRSKYMEDLGADVIRVRGNYENSLLECIKQSKDNNWQIVQDVAWKNYILIPKLTMAGYTVMMKEIADQINDETITHMILQAGVGGMAAAMIAGSVRYLKKTPKIIIVEPDSASCVMASVETGKIEKIHIVKESLMGGLSCNQVSILPWEIIKNSINYCVSLPDDDIAKTMQLLKNKGFSNDRIIAGENSAPGVISLIASCNDKKIKNEFKLNSNSNVLVIGCEGDTDQELYNTLLKK